MEMIKLIHGCYTFCKTTGRDGSDELNCDDTNNDDARTGDSNNDSDDKNSENNDTTTNCLSELLIALIVTLGNSRFGFLQTYSMLRYVYTICQPKFIKTVLKINIMTKSKYTMLNKNKDETVKLTQKG